VLCLVTGLYLVSRTGMPAARIVCTDAHA
jgi:hypothetical protein